jgi:hypothetical protein
MNKTSVRNKPFAANVVTIIRNIDDYNDNIFYRTTYPTEISLYGIQYSDGSDLINLPYVGDIDSPNGPTITLGISAFLQYDFTIFPEFLPI